MESSWEALDLDDTDISSTFSVRPCNHQYPKPSSLSQSPRNSFLSFLPSPSPPPPEPPREPPPSSLRRPIPGPAGTIQAAMLRMNRPQTTAEFEISTQEFIRRVGEDSVREFTRNPWVFVLNFLRRDGIVDPTPLSAVKKCENAERINKVVALVKSCQSNCLGDMMISLKDPTDTIGASVHRKVLTTGDYGKSLAVGSVLILQKVVVFRSPCASCYLNITKSNVVKVITADCGVQSLPEENVLATPTPEMPQTTLGLISRRNEGIVRDVQQDYRLQGMAVIQKLMGKAKSTLANSLVSSKNTDNPFNKFTEDPTHVDLVDSGCLSECRDGSTSLSSIQPQLVSAELLGNLEHNAEKGRQARRFSSAACMIKNIENRHVRKGNVGQMCTLLRGNKPTSSMVEKLDIAVVSSCPSMAENPDGFDSCEANVQKQRQHGDICSPSNMAESLANENICKINDSQKRRLLTNNVSMDKKQDDQEANEESEVKKQRLAPISRISIQVWTDEQLDILDMDED